MNIAKTKRSVTTTKIMKTVQKNKKRPADKSELSEHEPPQKKQRTDCGFIDINNNDNATTCSNSSYSSSSTFDTLKAFDHFDDDNSNSDSDTMMSARDGRRKKK
eukprot:344661_1